MRNARGMLLLCLGLLILTKVCFVAEVAFAEMCVLSEVVFRASRDEVVTRRARLLLLIEQQMVERYLTGIHFGLDGRIARDFVDELLSSEVIKMSPRCFLPITPRIEMLMISQDLFALLLFVPETQSAVDLLMVGTCYYCSRSPFRISAVLWAVACF
ncbi:hypothetical protein Nepgr_015772 [Nepenthes gracilis]|uniref:Uncharacterized protein n=1 Tax=Nepenthes gracilis TaxID=150966 RepID=A0AAD3SP77_NEPGR|nr:hypothetical protein Nepgr_015772 [Nepenthes gracilis]